MKEAKQTKQAFVAKLPANTSYDDALAKAKAAGVGPFSRAHWYTIKAKAKKRKAKPVKRAKARAPRPAPRMARSKGDGHVGLAHLEGVARLVHELGAERVRRIVDAIGGDDE